MPSMAPLQVSIFRNPADTEVAPFEAALMSAFQGGSDRTGSLANGDDLGVQLEIFSSRPALKPDAFLDSFCHSAVVVIVDDQFLEQSDQHLWDWLAECSSKILASNGRHRMVLASIDERIMGKAITKNKALGAAQWLPLSSLGERAIRPTMFALRLVHECRLLLADSLDDALAHLRLFISHAKLDGLPLAHALRHQIASLGWLSKFYDVDDIPPGSDWKNELEKGVGSSLIVILRTDAYDGRAWCQQEVFWADEYATPAVLVDARTRLDYPAGVLPLDRIPSVRIPDGNLTRILFAALREGLRFLLFNRRIEQLKKDGTIPSPSEMRVFCFQPGMSALLRACRSMAKLAVSQSTPRMIIYPDPPMRVGAYEAAQALVATYLPGARLVTPQTLAATSGGSQ